MSKVALSIAVLAVSAFAQESRPTQDELLETKLNSEFLKNAPWFTDWDDALAAAKERQRLVFAYFTTVNH